MQNMYAFLGVLLLVGLFGYSGEEPPNGADAKVEERSLRVRLLDEPPSDHHIEDVLNAWWAMKQVMSLKHIGITLLSTCTGARHLFSEWSSDNLLQEPLCYRFTATVTVLHCDSTRSLLYREVLLLLPANGPVTWLIVVVLYRQGGCDQNRTETYRFLKLYPEYIVHYSEFRSVPIDELPQNPKFVAQAVRVMYSLASVMDNLDDTALVTETMLKLGRIHAMWRISDQAFFVLLGAAQANVLGLSRQEASLLQAAWSVYQNDTSAVNDIAEAIRALVEQKPELPRFLSALAGVPMQGFEKHPTIVGLAQKVLNATSEVVTVLDNDERLEHIVRSYADWFHNRSLPIEELILYPTGLVAEKISERVDNKMPFRPDEALTKFVFAIAALLCSPVTNDFLGLSANERRDLQRAWTWFRNEPLFAMEILVSVFDMMPETRKLTPALDDIPTKELMKSERFKATVETLLTSLSEFVNNLDKYDQSVKFMRDLSSLLHKAGIPLLGTFLGGSILIVSAMKDHLGSEMDTLVERYMIKMVYASYPLLMEIERQEQLDL